MQLRPTDARSFFFSTSLAVAVTLGAAACSVPSTKIAPPPPPSSAPSPVPIESGFLRDYSRLRPSEQFADLKIYRDHLEEARYRKILFQPVSVWRGADRRLEDVSEEDLQYLADALYQAVQKKLRSSFEMVDKPGDGVLEIHLGFTLVTEEESSVDFFSTTVPVRNLSLREGPLVEGTKRFVRDCALEIELSEVKSAGAAPGAKPRRHVRAAFFDARRGAEAPKGNVSSWEEVHAMFEKWAGRIAERLESLRDGTYKPLLTVED